MIYVIIALQFIEYEGSWGWMIPVMVDFPWSISPPFLWLVDGIGTTAFIIVGTPWWYLINVGIVLLITKAFKGRLPAYSRGGMLPFFHLVICLVVVGTDVLNIGKAGWAVLPLIDYPFSVSTVFRSIMARVNAAIAYSVLGTIWWSAINLSLMFLAKTVSKTRQPAST